MENQKENFGKRFGKFHDRHYKLLLLIPILIMLFGIFYMFSFYSSNGDFIYRDISLTGGTSVTINQALSGKTLEQDLSSKLEDINTREIYNLVTGQQEAAVIETKSSVEQTKIVLEEYLGYELNEENSSVEFTGSNLSQSFFRQLLFAVLLAFVFMAIVVFIIFRNFVPSTAIIVSAFADIFMTLVVINIIEVKMSTAGIVAFLMLIGYSVDTDILLTNRVLRRSGAVNEKIFSAFKTGVTMTMTSIVAVLIALAFSSFSVVLTQIFLILSIGLGFDIINTWVTNVSILKWYVKRKGQE